jgi:hypothetical protein
MQINKEYPRCFLAVDDEEFVQILSNITFQMQQELELTVKHYFVES